MNYQLEKKSWDDFKDSNMFRIVNIVLRIFGWCLQYETSNGKIKSVTPIRIVRW